MLKRNNKNSGGSLVFSKRSSKKTFRRNGKNTHTKKVILYGGFFLLALISVSLGVFFARLTLPDGILVKNTAPNTILVPLSEKKDDEGRVRAYLYAVNIPFEKVLVATQSSDITIELSDGGYAYVTPAKDLRAQVDALQKITARLKIENPGKKLKYIDLRFSKPIVKY